MPNTFVRLGLPVVSLTLALGASTLGCSATADDPETRSRNNASGGTDPGSGGTDPGSGGVPGTGGTGNPTGGTGSSAGGTGSSAGGTGSSAGGTGSGSGGTGVVHPPANTALPFSEDFEDSIANGWIDSIDDSRAPFGAWTIISDPDGGMVYQGTALAGTSTESWAVGGDYQWTDQHFETRMKIISGTSEPLVKLAVRFSSFDSYYFLEIRRDRIKLRDRDAGDIGEFDIEPPIADGAWHNVGLSAIGSNLAVYLDGAPVLSGTGTTALAGGIALAVRGDAVVSFDDITVTAE